MANEKLPTIPLKDLKDLCEKNLNEAQKRCDLAMRNESDASVVKLVQEIVAGAREKVLKVLGEISENGLTTLEDQQAFCHKIEKIVTEAKQAMTENIKARDGSGVRRTASQNIARSHLSQVLGEAKQEIGQKYELKPANAGSDGEEVSPKKRGEKEKQEEKLKNKLEIICCQYGLNDVLDLFNAKSTEANPEFYSHVLKVLWPAFNALNAIVQDITEPEENDKKHVRKKWSGIGACTKLSAELRKFFMEMPFYKFKGEEERWFLNGVTDKMWQLVLAIEKINNVRKFESVEEDKRSAETRKILDAAKIGPAEFYVAVRDSNIKSHGGKYTSIIKPENLPMTIGSPLEQLLANLKREGEKDMSIDTAEFYTNIFNLENIAGGAKVLLPEDLIALLHEEPAPEEPEELEIDMTIEEVTAEAPMEELNRQNMAAKIEEYFAKLDSQEEDLLKALVQIEEKRGQVEKIMHDNLELLNKKADIETEIAKTAAAKKKIKEKLATLAKLEETVSFDFDQEVVNLKNLEDSTDNLQRQAFEVSARVYEKYHEAEALNEQINAAPEMLKKIEEIKAKRKAFLEAVSKLLEA